MLFRNRRFVLQPVDSRLDVLRLVQGHQLNGSCVGIGGLQLGPDSLRKWRYRPIVQKHVQAEERPRPKHHAASALAIDTRHNGYVAIGIRVHVKLMTPAGPRRVHRVASSSTPSCFSEASPCFPSFTSMSMTRVPLPKAMPISASGHF